MSSVLQCSVVAAIAELELSNGGHCALQISARLLRSDPSPAEYDDIKYNDTTNYCQVHEQL